MSVRRAAIVLPVLLAVALAPSAAYAGWSRNGSGSGYAGAVSVPAVAQPTTSTTGRNVTVSWSAVQLPGSVPVGGYVVRRYDLSGTPSTVGASCGGTIAGLTCTEAAVPAGSWRYAVAAVKAGWTGPDSPLSATVTMAAPSLTLTGGAIVTPAAVSGSLAQFATGETVVYRLDNASTGTVLSGTTTPSTIGAAGTASVSVTIPGGTSYGAHTVYAVGSLGSVASGSVVVKTPPSVTGAVIAKSAGGNGGYLKQGGTYYVYANATAGSPGPGTLALTANVSTITAGQTAVALSAGSWTVDGVTYGFRSALLTAGNPLASGAKSFTVTATYDSTTGSGTYSATVDNTAPSASDIQTTNGGVAGKIDAGDAIVFTASEQLDPNTVLAGWDGTALAVTVDFVNNGASDRFTVWNGTNTTQANLGTVTLGRKDYLTASTNVTGTMVLSGSTITITLGTPPGAGISTAAGTGTMQWTPVAAATDRAGNAMSTTARSETGAADVEL